MGEFIDGCTGGGSSSVFSREVYSYQPYVVCNEFEANVQFSDLDNNIDCDKISETINRIEMLVDFDKMAFSLFYFYKNLHLKYDSTSIDSNYHHLSSIPSSFARNMYHCVMGGGLVLANNKPLKSLLDKIYAHDSFIERVVDCDEFNGLLHGIGFHLYLASNDVVVKDKIKNHYYMLWHDSLDMIDFHKLDDSFKESFFNQALEQFVSKYL